MDKFTHDEAKLAEGLLGDETVQSYAQKNGISPNTVRTHLASLFNKTGVRRQSELVRVLLAIRPF